MAFKTYINQPCLKQAPKDDTNSCSLKCLEYWKQQLVKWPDLVCFARDVLAVPATSVDVERLFLQARNAISYNCHRLSDESISDIMFLRSATMRQREAKELQQLEDYHQWCEEEDVNITHECALHYNLPALDLSESISRAFSIGI